MGSRRKVTTRAPWYIISINKHRFLQKAHTTADAVYGALRRYPDPHVINTVIIVEQVFKDLLFDNNPDITFTAYKRYVEKTNPENKKRRIKDTGKTQPYIHVKGSTAKRVTPEDVAEILGAEEKD